MSFFPIRLSFPHPILVLLGHLDNISHLGRGRGREGEREGGREGGRERGREGEREGGREGRREGERERNVLSSYIPKSININMSYNI